VAVSTFPGERKIGREAACKRYGSRLKAQRSTLEDETGG